ncbi:Ionotropic receptor 335 [Blattella germanica]|nr:Ionotropic receptor 335 [Blattella germanica]
MSLKCIFVACYLLVSCWSQLSLPYEEDLEAYNMAECVYNISSIYFDRDLPIFVQAPRSTTHNRYLNFMETIIQKLQIQNQMSVILLRGTELLPMKNVKPGSYIIVLPTSITAGDLYYIKDTFVQIAINAYNAKGKVVIVNPEEKGVRVNGEAFPHFGLSIAWLANFLQTIFLNPEPIVGLNTNRKTPNFNVYGWTINDQTDLCSGDLDNIRHFDTWLSQEGRFSRDSKLFEVNEDIDLKGCKLNLYMKNLPPYSLLGSDGKCFGIVAMFLHSFSDLINVRWRTTHDLKTSHIVFPSYYKENALSTIYPKTYPNIFDKVTWLVPSGSEIPRWQSLWRAFSPLLWSLILLTFTCGTFTIWLLHKSTGEGIFSALVSSLLTHLGIGVRDRYKGFVPTIFFMIWLFYCLLINTVYQSEMFRLLVNPGTFPSIKTLKELEESHLIMERVLSLSETRSNWVNFLKQYKQCEGHTVIECYKKVAIYRTHAILDREMYTIEYLSTMDEFADEFGKPKLIPLKEGLGTLYVCLQIKRISGLLLGLLNNTFQKFISAGFFDFWSSSVHVVFRSNFIYRDFIDRFVFSLNHLQGPFILFFLGHLLASFIYVFEISTHLILNYFFLHAIARCLRRVYLF